MPSERTVINQFKQFNKGGGFVGKTSTEVKQRWIKANYQRYNINLRLDSDRELIEYIKRKQAEGLNITEIVRDALETKIDKGD